MRTTTQVLGLLIGLMSAPGLSAEEPTPVVHDPLSSRFMLDVGGFVPSLTTKARLDSPTLGRGTEISFEDDLDFSDREFLFFGQFTARLARRWRMQAEYVDLSRATSTVLEREINWGDNVYEIGSTVRGYFDVAIMRLALGYSFVRRPNWELGGTFGVHVMDVGAGLALQVQSGAGQTDREATADAGITAPLPNFGLYWAWGFRERWSLSARGDFFALEYNEFGGSLVAGSVNVHYLVSDNVVLGGGYSVFDIDADVTKTNWNGSFEFGYSGPRLFVSLRF